MNIEKLIKEDKLDPINRLTVFYNEENWRCRVICNFMFIFYFDNCD